MDFKKENCWKNGSKMNCPRANISLKKNSKSITPKDGITYLVSLEYRKSHSFK